MILFLLVALGLRVGLGQCLLFLLVRFSVMFFVVVVVFFSYSSWVFHSVMVFFLLLCIVCQSFGHFTV